MSLHCILFRCKHMISSRLIINVGTTTTRMKGVIVNACVPRIYSVSSINIHDRYFSLGMVDEAKEDITLHKLRVESSTKLRQSAAKIKIGSRIVKADDKAKEYFPENMDSERGSFGNFALSKYTTQKLKDAGINQLFSVQYDTFSHIKEGKDIIVQARTGTGKTVAFALPLLEKLLENQDVICVKSGFKSYQISGRAPVVLTLAPTRELAVQTYKEFEKFKSDKVKVSCFYGGSSYKPQESDLRNGIDILIGTPGRILDHIEKKNLDCSQLKHVILDEADRMMDMGFQKSLDEILSHAYTENNKPQTLLFSATVPSWVKQTAKKYMSENMRQFDFIGSEVNKSAVNVEHKAIKCPFQKRVATINNIIQLYRGKYRKIIIFTSTKREANELAARSIINMNSRVLHGDIPQRKREITLEGFRKGKFNCLIATDVASRGLDIAEVDLVIQTEPPNDIDSYIHRAGRTGRAGRSGLSIILYQQRQEQQLQSVQEKAGITFSGVRELISASRPFEEIKGYVKKYQPKM